LFDSRHLSHDLAGKSVRGGVTTMGAQGTRFVLQLTGTVVLARLLTPNDYGLIGMVTVVVNFAAMFKDAGLSMATVQKEAISHEQISTLFWINLLISVLLGLCVLGSSPLVARFYGKPELTAVTAALSLSFLVSGLTIQHQALLRRHMWFGVLAGIQITSCAADIGVAILLALAGWRYWALVGGTLAAALSGTLLTLYFCPWLPVGMRKSAGVGSMLKFGGHLTGFNFVNYFTRNLDNILIGKYIGDGALGLYSKAYQIVYMPLANFRAPITAVAFPVLSKLQNDPERFRRYYRRIVFALAFCSMPVMAFCIVFPGGLIRAVFGEQWLGMKDVFVLLAIAGYIQTVIGTRGILLLACGRSDIYFKLGALGALLAGAGFVIGLRWGITGVAASFVVVSYLPQYPMFRIAFRHTPCTFEDLLGSCIHPFIFSWISVLCAWGLVASVALSGPFMLLIAAVAMGGVYMGLCLVASESRHQLLGTMSLLHITNSPRPASRTGRLRALGYE
jgi:O-antigen/teichoic acid export membrane protein